MKKIVIFLLLIICLPGCNFSSSTSIDDSYKECNLMSDAEKITGFSFDISSEFLESFPNEKIFVKDNEIKVILSGFNNESAELVKSKQPITNKEKEIKHLSFGGKDVTFFKNDEIIWKSNSFYYALFLKNCDFEERTLYNVIDETDMNLDAKTLYPEYTEESAKVQFPDLMILNENGVITITNLKLDKEILTARDAKEVLNSFRQILGIEHIDTELIYDFCKENAYHFSQIYGTVHVASGYVNLFIDDDGITIQSHYKKVINLDKTSTITQEKAKEIIAPYGELRKEELIKYVICRENYAELAYEMVLKDDRVFYVSAKTGEVIEIN